MSSELHCAESEGGDTGAMVELVLVVLVELVEPVELVVLVVLVEPYCCTQHLFMTQLGSN